MKDRPEDVRTLAAIWAYEGAKASASMLNRYADLRERMARPVSDEDVESALQVHDEVSMADWNDGAMPEGMRAALDAYCKSLLGETE